MKKNISKALSIILIISLIMAALSACGNKITYNPLEGIETVMFTDDAGRQVEIPANVERIAPSGAVAQMILLTIAPDLMVGLASSPTMAQRKYFAEETWYLPTFGQLYGSKSTMNLESLISAQPQLIIDLGDRKDTIRADMNRVQQQTGIPTIFIEATLDTMEQAYTKLGQILGREEQGAQLSDFIHRTVAMAEENSAKIPDNERKSVLYGTGSSGLACNASGSTQAEVIDIVGCVNAIQVPENEITNAGGGTLVNLEQIYNFNPDIIVLSSGGPYESLPSGEWNGLKAVQEGSCYEIPGEPYDWMASPPSVNKVIGVWWLGKLAYPEIYNDYDMIDIAQEFYRLFWHYDLSEEEAREMMAKSVFKD